MGFRCYVISTDDAFYLGREIQRLLNEGYVISSQVVVTYTMKGTKDFTQVMTLKFQT